MFLIVALLLLATAEAPRAANAALAFAGETAGRALARAEGPGRGLAISAPTFLAPDRAVSNWRLEMARTLEPSPLSAVAVALRIERPVVTRCVKLNNYWCIKSARWIGELGTDDEGHVGFASAESAADAAAMLLKRYYVDYGRKSALDIVRRWAPAECNVSLLAGGNGAPVAVALRGIGNTLRARWLAGHRRGKPLGAAGAARRAGTAKARMARISVVPLKPLPTVRLPDIAAGLGERLAPAVPSSPLLAWRKPPSPLSSSGRTPPSMPPTLLKPAPGPAVAVALSAPTIPKPAPALACAPDEQRIRNYATRIAAALKLKARDDLKLFDPEGRPLPNLTLTMLAMSGFELGLLKAGNQLVAGAIDRLAQRQIAQAAETVPSP